MAGIQSVYQRACELDRFDLVIVDEAHLIPPEGDGRYRTFLADAKVVNPNLRLIGLTATPYRMKSGMLCGPDNLLNDICYEIGVKELIAKGFLCPLRSKAGRMKVDTSSLHVRAGEFIGSEVEELMDTDELVGAACREIVEMTKERRSVLIFAASVAHAEHVKTALERMTGGECGLVTGDTPSTEREHLIARFKGEQIPANLFGDTYPPLKYLVNVNVFDYWIRCAERGLGRVTPPDCQPRTILSNGRTRIPPASRQNRLSRFGLRRQYPTARPGGCDSD